MASPAAANEPDDEFFGQVAQYLDGQMSAVEFARFEEILAADSRKCALFSEICVQATLIAELGIHATQNLRHWEWW